MDIYFKPEYGKMNESIEQGKAETFSFDCEYGKVQSLYIKREVPYLIDGVQYFDAITPYGYGGPVIVEAEDKEKLLAAYNEAYKAHCEKEKTAPILQSFTTPSITATQLRLTSLTRITARCSFHPTAATRLEKRQRRA